MRITTIIRRFKRRRRIKILLSRLRWQEKLVDDQITGILNIVRRAEKEWDIDVASHLFRMYRTRRVYGKRAEALTRRLQMI